MAQVNIQKLSKDEIEKRGIRNWPIWTKEASRFDWSYDQTEECLILEGTISVETPDGTFTIGPGDFVTFAKGLQCVWNITTPVRKHYNFI
jgi:uncharacterized cupin superfamily protein